MSNLGMEPEIIENLEAALEASEARVRELLKSIQLADDFLTTAQGGDIVRGEACKHHVREILRAALSSPSGVGDG